MTKRLNATCAALQPHARGNKHSNIVKRLAQDSEAAQRLTSQDSSLQQKRRHVKSLDKKFVYRSTAKISLQLLNIFPLHRKAQ